MVSSQGSFLFRMEEKDGIEEMGVNNTMDNIMDMGWYILEVTHNTIQYTHRMRRDEKEVAFDAIAHTSGRVMPLAMDSTLQ
jgi:hypothetical protein